MIGNLKRSSGTVGRGGDGFASRSAAYESGVEVADSCRNYCCQWRERSSFAAVAFSGNFNTYAYQLNWVPPANGVCHVGSVDLIGQTTTITNYNFFPGNGGYVDLDGSTGQVGTLQTATSFAAGTYTLSFDLGGNARVTAPRLQTLRSAISRLLSSVASADPLSLRYLHVYHDGRFSLVC